jgi:hypothetical protein
MTKRKEERLRAQAQQEAEDTWVAVVRALPGGGQSVTLEHENTQPVCNSDWHRAVIGPDGVGRCMTPSGRVYEPRRCTNPKCVRPCNPVTLEELQALEEKNRGAQ